MASFATCHAVNPDPLPFTRLTVARWSLDCFAMGRSGLLVEGASARLVRPANPCRRPPPAPGIWEEFRFRDGIITLGNSSIRTEAHAFAGRVFLCPRCSRVCYRLYDVGGWQCRTCARLVYPSKGRQRRTGVYTIAYLRRRARLDERPFTPIPPGYRISPKRLRLLLRIRELETKMIGGLRAVADDVAKHLAKQTETDPDCA